MHLARSLRGTVSHGRAVTMAGVSHGNHSQEVTRGDACSQLYFLLVQPQTLSPFDGTAHIQGPCSVAPPWKPCQ